MAAHRRTRDWLLNLSIKKKLYLIMGLLIADVALVISLGVFALSTSASIQASIAAEDIWAKAQKTAVYSLEKYALTQEESDYRDYLQALVIPDAYGRANDELQKAVPDPRRVQAALREARMHPKDVPGVARLFQYFRGVPHVGAAFRAWSEAQTLVSGELRERGQTLRERHLSGAWSKAQLAAQVKEIEELNHRITALELEFSSELLAGSRWAANFFLLAMVLGSLGIGGLSVSLAYYLSRVIVDSVGEISRSAARAAEGDLTARVAIRSKDELGQVAAAFNHMTEGLGKLDVLKTEFFSNVSHEFRTPLTLILGPVEELLSSRNEGVPRENLELIHRNAIRLQKLVNSLLDFSRLEAGRLEAHFVPTDLSTCTREIASHFATAMEQAGLAYVVRCEEAPEKVYVDRDLWEKVVSNLLSNALKFTFQGTISVELRYDVAAGAALTVRDTGTGIPSSELPHLFQRFHRIRGAVSRTHEGSGIGLSLVRELARVHGGTVEVESAEGKGTAFTVRLRFGRAHLPGDQVSEEVRSTPVGRVAEAHARELAQWHAEDFVPLSPDGTKPRLLVVDDNADMRAYVARLLESQWAVELACDGAEALERIRSRPPDLVLSDVMMPRKDGFELLHELRESAETRHLPIILLSARAGEESRAEGITAGADDYLIKPFSARELVARVNTHLRMSRVRREAASHAAIISRLEQERKWLESTLNLMPIPLLLAEAGTGRITFANRAADAKAGGSFPLCESVADYAKAYRLTDEQDRDISVDAYPLTRAVRGEEITAEPVVWHTAAGRFSLLVSADSVSESYGHSRTIVCAFQDVTALSRELAARDDFLSIASHELKTPITSLKLQLQLAQRELASAKRLVPAEERLTKLTKIFALQVDRLKTLVDDLLDVSRIRLGKLSLVCEPCSLSELSKQTLEQLSTDFASAHCPVEVSIEEGVTGLWDRKRIQQVMANLITNATKYAPGKPILVSLRAGEERATLSVRDFGPGIAKDRQAKLFERYERGGTSPNISGLGLGLFISREIIEAHGGSIDVSSEPGKGSLFTVSLPRQPGVGDGREEEGPGHRGR